jgi:hypothetical protein
MSNNFSMRPEAKASLRFRTKLTTIILSLLFSMEAPGISMPDESSPAYSGLHLEIVSYPEGDVLFSMNVEKGFRFSTLIRHSVHLTPVYECYRVESDGRFVVESTRLQDMGWGVPSTFENPYRIENGFMVIEQIERKISFLPFRVSHVNQPAFVRGCPDGEKPLELLVRLDEYAKDGKRIDIRVRYIGVAGNLPTTRNMRYG